MRLENKFLHERTIGVDQNYVGDVGKMKLDSGTSSVKKALLIMKILCEEPYECSLTDFANYIGIVKSGAFKILNDLVEMGFVMKNEKTKQYRLGPAAFRMGIVYSDMKGIEEESNNVLRAISSMTGMSVLVGMRDGEDAFLAYKLDSEESFSYEGRRGRKFPLHAGALGKLLGAYLPEEQAEEILKRHALPQKTDLTITDYRQILKQYEDIRKSGYVLTLGENIPGAFGLAVPIFDRKGEVWSCLCIAGPLELYKEDMKSKWLRILREGAKEISHKLGIRQPS